MTSAPADLSAWRSVALGLTGLPADAIGIVGDGAHQQTGGYHEGEDVLTAIGRYHGPATAHVGSATEDYSVRILRDRLGLNNHASGIDLGANWPKGGRAAWLRYNNLLVARLRANDPDFAAIRAINYSPDGVSKKRIDRQNNWRVEDSSDSVDTHTHHEYYRDTEGKRATCLDAQTLLIRQAQGANVNTAVESSPGHIENQISAMYPEVREDFAGVMAALTALAAKVDALTAKVDALSPPVSGDLTVAGTLHVDTATG